jgi:hypothetical protein
LEKRTSSLFGRSSSLGKTGGATNGFGALGRNSSSNNNRTTSRGGIAPSLGRGAEPLERKLSLSEQLELKNGVARSRSQPLAAKAARDAEMLAFRPTTSGPSHVRSFNTDTATSSQSSSSSSSGFVRRTSSASAARANKEAFIAAEAAKQQARSATLKANQTFGQSLKVSASRAQSNNAKRQRHSGAAGGSDDEYDAPPKAAPVSSFSIGNTAAAALPTRAPRDKRRGSKKGGGGGGGGGGDDDASGLWFDDGHVAASGATLSDEQLNVVSTIERKANVFFTGCAGTGKSYLLSYLTTHVLPKATTYVCASTGVSAVAIKGKTVHSFAGVGLANGTAEELVLNMSKGCVLFLVNVFLRLSFFCNSVFALPADSLSISFLAPSLTLLSPFHSSLFNSTVRRIDGRIAAR